MESTSTTPTVTTHGQSADDADTRAATETDDTNQETSGGRTKLYAILGGAGMLLIFALIIAGLYMLGDDDESALERLRDIAVIFIVLMSMIIVILMAAGTAALIFLVLQIRNQVIPLLQETTQTVNRLRGTTEFMSEEAVKPIISAAGKVAQVKAMLRVVTGR
ncbi:MAG: hypothetical protein AB7G88_15805 [Thermomicrobiales bacterium]